MITKEKYFKYGSRKFAALYTISCDDGSYVKLTNYGACIVALGMPDKDGNIVDVVLGYDTYEGFNEGSYMGAIVGRVANRIKDGKFMLDGVTYKLTQNSGKNSIHGGVDNFSRKCWNVLVNEDDNAITFFYNSDDGEEGYPGTLKVRITYSLNDKALTIAYKAITDEPTPCALTNHVYFNLNGHNSGDILSQQLYMDADYFLPVDSTLVPTGELRSVKDTPFDFTSFKALGKDIDAKDEQIKLCRGYDLSFVHNNPCTSVSDIENGKPQAVAIGDKSGIKMEMYTSFATTQLYTANSLHDDDGVRTKLHTSYPRRSGFCLETGEYNNAVNTPSFPSVILKKGEVYQRFTTFKFGVEK